MPVKDFSGQRPQLGCGEPLDLGGTSNLCFLSSILYKLSISLPLQNFLLSRMGRKLVLTDS